MGHNQEVLLDPLHLITLVRDTPIIYDSTTVAFRMPDKREHAWRSIASQLNSNVKDVKKRWRSLRDRHARELKRLKSSDRQNNWEFGADMNFLNKYIKARTTLSIRSENSNHNDDGGGFSILPINSPNSIKFENSIASDNIQGLTPNNCLSFKTEYLQGTIDDADDNDDDNDADYDYENNINNNSHDIIYNDTNEIIVEEEDYSDDGNNQSESKHQNNAECFIGNYQYCNTDNKSTKTNQKTTVSIIDESLQPNSQEILTKLVPDEDDHFCKAIALTIKKLSRLNNIKAKAEIYKILERLIESEENDKNK